MCRPRYNKGMSSKFCVESSGEVVAEVRVGPARRDGVSRLLVEVGSSEQAFRLRDVLSCGTRVVSVDAMGGVSVLTVAHFDRWASEGRLLFVEAA